MIEKSWLLTFGFIVLAATVVLTSSLHDVNFQPGRSLSTRTLTGPAISLPVVETLAETPLWKLLLFWLAFVVNLILFFLLLPPELRKRIIRQALSFAIGALILLLALRYKVLDLPGLRSEPVRQGEATTAVPDPSSLAPVFHPPTMTAWVTYLISLGALLALLILGWAGYRAWVRSRGRKYSALAAIAGIARDSLDDLAAGREWSDVILQSYARMSEIVSARRGLQRGDAMTAREFAERLVHAGLPAESVTQLTRLFESVRYGGRKSSPSDVNEAVACLHSILYACGVTQ